MFGKNQEVNIRYRITIELARDDRYTRYGKNRTMNIRYKNTDQAMDNRCKVRQEPGNEH